MPNTSVKGSVGVGYGRLRPAIIRDRRSAVRKVMTRVAYAGGVVPSSFCLMEDAPLSAAETRKVVRGDCGAGAAVDRVAATFWLSG